MTVAGSLEARVWFDARGARPGQIGAYEAVMGALQSFRDGRRPRPECSVILPPGYGKSHLVRWIAASAWGSGLAACTLVISPADYLRGQMVDAGKMADFVKHFRVGTAGDLRLRTDVVRQPGARYAVNGEFLLSTTMQLAQRTGTFEHWIESVAHRQQLPVLVVVDEVQMNSVVKEWGRAVRSLQGAGAFVVVMTGTAFREDGDPIVGFVPVEIATEDVSHVKVKPHDVPEKVWKEYWSGTKTYYELAADFAHSFRDAWDENAMCHVTHHKFDLEVAVVQGGRLERQLLSRLSIAQARDVLGRVVREPDVIARGAGMGVEWLHWLRRMHPGVRDVALLVFCANDEQDESNEHPEAVKRAILAADPSLSVVIATSTQDGQPGKTALEDFALRGIGDVLVVKQMAGMGMDAERVKVVLDLSPVRAAGATVQRICRGTRPYEGLYLAHWITPADPLSSINFKLYVDDEGGANATTAWELERREEAPREETTPRPIYQFGPTTLFDLDDTKRNHAGWAGLERLVRVIDLMPALLAMYTVPELLLKLPALEAIFGAAPAIDPVEVVVNTDDVAGGARRRINDHARTLAHLRFQIQERRSYARGDSALYGPIIQQVFREAYERAGVPLGPGLDHVRDLGQLEAIERALSVMLSEVTA